MITQDFETCYENSAILVELTVPAGTHMILIGYLTARKQNLFDDLMIMYEVRFQKKRSYL